MTGIDVHNRNGASRLALIQLVSGALLISFSGVWVKVAAVSPTVSAFYRVFFGGLFLLGAALYRRELRWRGGKHLMLGLLCGLFFSLDLLCYHYSIHYVGPGLGTILPNFQVFILSAVGILFLKEKMRWVFLFSVPLAFLGLFLIVGVQWHRFEPHFRYGLYLGLAAAAFYSAFLLSLRKLQADQSGNSIFYVLLVVSATTAFFLAIEVQRTGDSFRIPDLGTLFALIALGLFSQFVGWILITNALPGLRTSLSGFILLLQPALAFVWDVVLFQRATSLVNWMGVIVVLLAIYLGTTGTISPRK